MRGEFIRYDGLVIPNNISIAGAQAILRAAFHGDSLPIWAALVQGPPTIDMTMADMTEPTVGVNGYARIAIVQDDTGWITIDDNGTEAYIESDWLEWVATSTGFDEAIQRVALVGTETYSGTDDVIALSSLMPAEITIVPATLLADRRFKYRLYL